MPITQAAHFQGYKDMDPALIPESIWRKEGVENYEFKTVLW